MQPLCLCAVGAGAATAAPAPQCMQQTGNAGFRAIKSNAGQAMHACLQRSGRMQVELVPLPMQAPAGTGAAATAPQYAQQAPGAGYPTINAPAKTVT